ncbi:hypothetical protein [Yersinia kristensenii]|uniref:hypothetical protein n=1 Tax=Yersinia kristensenii TaxID=28152 RepID=UPI0005E55E23|nr:hypothetical protein [Yersinia kristensenii]CFR19937.1 Uncharacterised protein [Yersinia kristensenii]
MADPFTIAMGAMIGGSLLNAGSQYSQGKAAKKQAYGEASQLDKQANSVRAQSQLQAMEDRRQARLAESRALAVGAASGAAADSTSFVNNISNMESQGELNALTSLWGGNQQGNQLNNQAAVRRAEGDAAKKAGKINAMSSLLQTGGSLYDRFGGSSPTPKAAKISAAKGTRSVF